MDAIYSSRTSPGFQRTNGVMWQNIYIIFLHVLSCLVRLIRKNTHLIKYLIQDALYEKC
jgi:hypothetical protein